MNKLLLIPALFLTAQAAYAQSPATKNTDVPGTPMTKGSGVTRSDVKAAERASGSAASKNIDVPATPSTKGSGTARSDVKAEERASGSLGTKNTEIPATPGKKPGKTMGEMK